MSRKISLIVNDMPIEMDYFVEGYVYHVTTGILASLKDTEAIQDLELNVYNNGEVKIVLNGAEVPLTYFPVQIIKNTLAGMVSNLKGVDKEMSTLELEISQ